MSLTGPQQATTSVAESPRAGTRVLGFTSQEEELSGERLATEGEFPSWLSGTLVRVTPAKMEIGGEPIRHWFDGLAMLNAFSFANGRVTYGSRFLESRAYAGAREGKVDYVGFANDPCRAFFKRVSLLFERNVNDNCNVNLARLGDRYIAMTELPLPIEFDPATQATKGPVLWQDELRGHFSSAHPHFDFERGELLNYLTSVSRTGRISYRVFAAAGPKRRLVAEVPVKREFGYMHAFALTERFVVLTEFPLLLDPMKMMVDRPKPIMHQFEWKPERGSRYFVLDRASGDLVKTFELPANFAFHHVNAFEREGEIVMDVIILEDGPSPIEKLELRRARDPHESLYAEAYLHRFRLPLDGRSARDERLSDEFFEMPRINYRVHNTRDYRFIFGIGAERGDSDWWSRIVKLDLDAHEAARWSEPGCYPSEPIFVQAPGSRGEDDGVLLSVVLDSAAERSFLLALDASNLEEIARADAPHHIPFGFHGEFFSEARSVS